MTIMWGFGNTTVRNPNRIPKGLDLLLNSQFNGNLDSRENEIGFAKELGKYDIIALSENSDIDSSGRKWRSCFSQLGFITHKFSRKKVGSEKDPIILDVIKEYPDLKLSGNSYEITPQGYRLALCNSIIEAHDIMMRSLLCYELPSLIEKKKNTNEKFKPFVFALQVLDELAKIDESRGLTTTEMVALQVVNSHSKVQDVVTQILTHRYERDSAIGKVKKSRVDREFRETLVKDFTANESSANTYADRNFRYMRATGLISRKGKTIILNPDKKLVINKILDTEPKFAETDTDYLFNLWNGYPIPTDDKKLLIEEIVRLSSLMNESVNKATLFSIDVPELQNQKVKLESRKAILEEELYAAKQSDGNNIIEIIEYLEALNGKKIKNDNIVIDDKPAFLEWAVWRAFLSINNLRNKPYDARRFKVDQDFYPVGTAPGNGPDIIFEFDDYVLVVEVTLTSSSRQEAAEGEPVRRHIAMEKEKYDKPVYGLFIAKTIDNNTAETFRIGVWYRGDKPEFINIVPITLTQFVSIMKKFSTSSFSNEEFRLLLEKCLIPRNSHAPLWKSEINREIGYFSNN